jgi:hypothetical protein
MTTWKYETVQDAEYEDWHRYCGKRKHDGGWRLLNTRTDKLVVDFRGVPLWFSTEHAAVAHAVTLLEEGK